MTPLETIRQRNAELRKRTAQLEPEDDTVFSPGGQFKRFITKLKQAVTPPVDGPVPPIHRDSGEPVRISPTPPPPPPALECAAPQPDPELPSLPPRDRAQQRVAQRRAQAAEKRQAKRSSGGGGRASSKMHALAYEVLAALRESASGKATYPEIAQKVFGTANVPAEVALHSAQEGVNIRALRNASRPLVSRGLAVRLGEGPAGLEVTAKGRSELKQYYKRLAQEETPES